MPAKVKESLSKIINLCFKKIDSFFVQDCAMRIFYGIRFDFVGVSGWVSGWVERMLVWASNLGRAAGLLNEF
jgi:hypothetical protein